MENETTNMRSYPRTENLQSHKFGTKKELRQDVWCYNKGNKGKNKEAAAITEYVFADNLAILELQYNLTMWSKSLQDINLRINVDKTKVMR